MSQSETLLEYFKRGGTLTVAEAMSKFGVYALSQRCTGLRKDGHNIVSEMVEQNGKRFARYRLVNASSIGVTES